MCGLYMHRRARRFTEEMQGKKVFKNRRSGTFFFPKLSTFRRGDLFFYCYENVNPLEYNDLTCYLSKKPVRKRSLAE